MKVKKSGILGCIFLPKVAAYSPNPFLIRTIEEIRNPTEPFYFYLLFGQFAYGLKPLTPHLSFCSNASCPLLFIEHLFFLANSHRNCKIFFTVSHFGIYLFFQFHGFSANKCKVLLVFCLTSQCIFFCLLKSDNMMAFFRFSFAQKNNLKFQFENKQNRREDNSFSSFLLCL